MQVKIMGLRSILVNLDVDDHSTNLAKCASSLAQRFNAELIGVAAAALSPPIIGLDGSAVYATYSEQERDDIERRLRDIEDEFRLLASGVGQLGWFSFVASPINSLTSLASRADVILVASHAESRNRGRSVDIGELLLTAGRPVLVAGPDVGEIRADKIVIGWKDTREARRAVLDALPFLEAASEVTVASIDEGDLASEKSALHGVLSWLSRHGVKAQGDVYPLEGTAGETLKAIMARTNADLVVTGAYGHSRVREWIFGGVTDDLLADPSLNRFMSN
jgi:nucleotide-binding universal stress UspA family protein